MDAKQLVDEFQTTWHAMKQAMDDSKTQNAVAIRQMNSRLDQIETKLQRPPLETKVYNPDNPPSADMRLYFKMVAAGGPNGLREARERADAERLLRDIETKLGPREQKVLMLGDDTLGGFLAPSELVGEIIRGVQLISPIRQYARVRTTTFRNIQVPVRSNVFTAQWVGESATRTETQGLTFGLEDVPVHEMYAFVLVSLQDLEDSAFDLGAEIAREASEQFAKLEGAAFVSGDSSKKPEGFMFNTAVEHTPSGSASAITSDALITLAYALKEDYARNATFFLKRETVGAIRLLKNSQDVYVWEPNYQAGRPPTILGIPYAEVADMPSVTGGAFPVAIGDWSRAYLIVDRVDMSVQRLNERYAEQGQVAFLIRKRVGGQLVLPEAARKLEIALS